MEKGKKRENLYQLVSTGLVGSCRTVLRRRDPGMQFEFFWFVKQSNPFLGLGMWHFIVTANMEELQIWLSNLQIATVMEQCGQP
jgi:hypothetical protein